MSESDAYKFVTSWIDWHLTPAGWVSGSSKDEDGDYSTKPAPDDRVLTERYGEEGTEMAGKKSKTSEQWRSDDAKAVTELVKKYGHSPKSFWQFPNLG